MRAWDACTLEQSSVLRWIECHPALGSYFTLAAILVAIGAAWATLRADRRRRRSAAEKIGEDRGQKIGVREDRGQKIGVL